MKLYSALLCLALSSIAYARPVSFMQYNAENSFDTLHDKGTEDWTYLPHAVKVNTPEQHAACKKMSTSFYVEECLNLDWNETKFTKKMQNVAKVIKAFDNTNKGADIVMLEEIENINVLNQLVAKALPGLGYDHKALIEGDDTRGILQVDLNVNGKAVTVFVNHWPSQSNPTEQRVASAQMLEKLASQSKSALILAAGDFNTLKTENPRPFAALANWTDVEPEARKANPSLHAGTHFYKGEWSSLDHIFVYKKSTVKVDVKNFQIMNRPFLLKKDSRSNEMIPNRFNFETAEGFSDHLPMGIVIDI